MFIPMQSTMSNCVNIVVSLVNDECTNCGIWLIFPSVLSGIYVYVLYNWILCLISVGGLGLLVYQLHWFIRCLSDCITIMVYYQCEVRAYYSVQFAILACYLVLYEVLI